MTRRMRLACLVAITAVCQAVLTVGMWADTQAALDFGGPANVPSTARWGVAILSFPAGYLPQAWLVVLQGKVGDAVLMLALLGLNSLAWGVCVVGIAAWLANRRGKRGYLPV